MLIPELASIVGDKYVRPGDPSDEFAHDSTFITAAPDVVIRPADTNQVAAVVRVLGAHEMPITCRGAGTGLSGGAVAIEGGAIVCLDRLTKLEIDASSLTVVAGAGVITADLQAAAARHGLMYPPDPASVAICTVGGNIATNAGGPSSLKYGVTSEYVMGLVIVLADGRVIKLGGKARKRSAGYRLTQLFVGSEGTLGVITEAVLRLIPAPKARGAMLASFDSVVEASAAVTNILQAGYLPAACELIDRSSLGFVQDLLPEDYPKECGAVLLVEQDGRDWESVRSELSDIMEITRKHGASHETSEVGEEGRAGLWAARRSIGLRLIERRNHRLPEDICVPIDKIPEMTTFIQTVSTDFGLTIAVFGHAGDGNLHPSLIFEDKELESLRRVSEAVLLIFDEAIRLGGSVSAEHGLGATKREFAERELGAEAVGYMKAIKAVFDPKGMLNPGKMFPTGSVVDAKFMESLPGWLP